MILTVKPSSLLAGSVMLPASKSYSIRAFMIAACGGVSQIISPSSCDDARVARQIARALGARVKKCPGDHWLVQAGCGKHLARKIHVGESGTVLRFVLPLLALRGKKTLVTGQGTLRGRPNHYLLEVLRRHGVQIRGKGPQESIPVVISGGQLEAGEVKINGSVSSQFISALLIACPQLPEDTRMRIIGRELVSADYILMTQQLLKKAAVRLQKINQNLYRIPGRQRFKGLRDFCVPSDYGLAAFLMAAGALTPSRMYLKGHFHNSLVQADGRILGFFRQMGIPFAATKSCIKISGPAVIKGGVFSLRHCPDLVPVMAVLALFAKGKTRLCNIHHARVKESDRISDLRKELLKIGADIRETKSELIINPLPRYKNNVTLNPHLDHRLAMAFSVLGVRIGVRVKDIECVSKSYPDFVRDLRALGVQASARSSRARGAAS